MQAVAAVATAYGLPDGALDRYRRHIARRVAGHRCWPRS